MNAVEKQLDKLGIMKVPLEVGTASVVLCFATRKLFGVKPGVNCESLFGAAKAFLTITGIGAAVAWMNNKEKNQQLSPSKTKNHIPNLAEIENKMLHSYYNFYYNIKPSIKFTLSTSLISVLSYYSINDSLGFKTDFRERLKSIFFVGFAPTLVACTHFL